MAFVEMEYVVHTRPHSFLQGTQQRDQLPQRDGQPECQVLLCLYGYGEVLSM